MKSRVVVGGRGVGQEVWGGGGGSKIDSEGRHAPEGDNLADLYFTDGNIVKPLHDGMPRAVSQILRLIRATSLTAGSLVTKLSAEDHIFTLVIGARICRTNTLVCRTD